MIYLLPFLNAFLLYVSIEKDQIFNKPYTYLLENWFVYLPAWLIKILGGCVLCTATWMGIAELLLWRSAYPYQDFILIITYNAIVTNILYKFSQ